MRTSLAASWLIGAAVAAANAAVVVPLAIEPRLSSISASPNGQTVYAVDESGARIVAFEPCAVGPLREVVAFPVADEARAVVVAVLPGDVLAIVRRRNDAWSLDTCRLRGSETQPVQRMPLGEAPGDPRITVPVSRLRDWLAVVGLPPPLQPVMRMVCVGGSLRRLDDGHPAAVRGRAAASVVAPADELVVLENQEDDGPATIVYRTPGGRELLRLDTGIRFARGMAFTRRDGGLHVIAGPGGEPAGLWRLDAVLRDGVQAVRPVFVTALDDPRAIVAVSSQSFVVTHGAGRPTVSRIDLIDDTAAAAPPGPESEHREPTP
ncbi:MAG: hypothetical protein ACKO4T_09760 [Planctomycetaceae bacterium]